MMVEQIIKGMGMSWYSPESWQRLEAIPEAQIEKSYSDFVQDFNTAKRKFVAQGLEVEKIPVDINHMIAWCHSHGYQIDGKGRAVYGAILVMAREHPDALDAPVIDNTQDIQ
jgi:hypothetical protein